jgi:hypothetical protein
MKQKYAMIGIFIVAVMLSSQAFAKNEGEYIKEGALNEVGRIGTHTALGVLSPFFNIFGYRGYPNCGYYGYGRYGYSYLSPYESAYQQEMEMLRRQEYYRQQRIEEERGRNDAYRDFYGR